MNGSLDNGKWYLIRLITISSIWFFILLSMLPLDYAFIDYFLCLFATHFVLAQYDMHKSKNTAAKGLAIIHNETDNEKEQ